MDRFLKTFYGSFRHMYRKINTIMIAQVVDKISQGLTVTCSHANNPRTVLYFVHLLTLKMSNRDEPKTYHTIE